MTTVPYNVPTTAPYRQRVNVRLIVFILVISAPFLWIIGSTLRHSITGGVIDRGEYKEVDLKALGNFPFDDMAGQMEHIPERFRQLDGQKVRLTGYMFAPEYAGDRGRKFQFVYNVANCCFNGPPQVQERVFAYAKEDKELYSQYDFAEVIGTLHVRLIKDPTTGKITSVYDMDVDQTRKISS